MAGPGIEPRIPVTLVRSFITELSTVHIALTSTPPPQMIFALSDHPRFFPWQELTVKIAPTTTHTHARIKKIKQEVRGPHCSPEQQ